MRGKCSVHTKNIPGEINFFLLKKIEFQFSQSSKKLHAIHTKIFYGGGRGFRKEPVRVMPAAVEMFEFVEACLFFLCC